MVEPLLAKSRKPGHPVVTLEAHLADTERSAEGLFRPNRRLFRAFVRFFRLTPNEASRLGMHLRVAALLHDIGKANAHFHGAVTGQIHVQAIRHEHLSAILLFVPEIRAWLSQNADLDLDVLVGAVLSHHLKASAEEGPHRWCSTLPDARVPLYLDHPEIENTLARISRAASLGPPPKLARTTWHTGSPWKELYDAGIRQSREFARVLRRAPARRGLLLAVKTGLIVSDAVSSALVREGHSIDDWIEETVHREAISEDDLWNAILRPRMGTVAGIKNSPFRFHRFQELAAQQPARTLLLAACGVGKTLAAWRWAAAQATQREFGSVIFLYPTRGTATEGFRDYVGAAPEGDAALVSGTARYELEGFLANPSDALKGKDPRLSEQDARLFALGLWSRRYFSATVDQFFGFLEHQYTSVCLLPLLADSVLIVDEVHAFDRKMFDGLIAFLGAFDVPVLCMTATLPSARHKELERAGLATFPREEHRCELPDLSYEEQRPRYALQYLETADAEAAAFERAIAAYRRGVRVLWVVNVVGRAQLLAKRIEAALGALPLVYHSRFKLSDRQDAHRRVVQGFQHDGPTIAVTTQVCEMSLDLDADVLVSELALVSSLIQRFGRANRHPKSDRSFRADVLVYRAESAAPYVREELDTAEAFIRKFHNRHVSQHEFATELERIASQEPAATGFAPLLGSGYFAIAGSLRDIDDYSGTCILDADIPAIEECRRARRPWDGFVLSAPRRVIVKGPDWLPPYVGVTSADAYDRHLGLLVSTRNFLER